MSFGSIIKAIVGSAMLGLALGGGFGCVAGWVVPEFFAHFIPWQDVRPVGFAFVIGATGGVLLGGGMGCFAIIIKVIMMWLNKSRHG